MQVLSKGLALLVIGGTVVLPSLFAICPTSWVRLFLGLLLVQRANILSRGCVCTRKGLRDTCRLSATMACADLMITRLHCKHGVVMLLPCKR